jgi:exodeoxyribonuclease-5
MESFLRSQPQHEARSIAPLKYVSDDALTPEQTRVIDFAVNWALGILPDEVKQQCPSQVLTIGGLAGTGKTTISRKIRERISEHLETATAAFTGRAVSVLRRKGITDAVTLHSLMYWPKKDSKGNLKFTKKEHLDVGVVGVDEASMVNLDQHRDLLSFGVKVLYIGDHGQLEPIGDNPKLMASPNLVLEEIHRNAGAIAEFAHRLRRHNTFFPFVVNDQVRVAKIDDFLPAALEADVAIVGYNKTRHRVNQFVRENRGFSLPLPEVGERVICLQNNRHWNVYNGLILTVTRVIKTNNEYHVFNAEDDLGNKWLGLPTFLEQYGKNDLTKDYNLQKNRLYFDFAYCLTCHKAQGGEWARVAVMEEHNSSWDVTKWNYTAASRPYEHLTWCH